MSVDTLNGTHAMPTAVVLAAGLGSRLATSHSTSPKPVREILGRPLAVHVLETLRDVGVRRLIVVTGFEADRVERRLLEDFSAPDMLEFVRNDEYRKSNGLSAMKGLARAGTDCLLTMADHVVDEALYRKALKARPPLEGLVLCVDGDIDGVFDLDDATKVVCEDGRIVKIGKELGEYNAVDTGVFHVTQGLRLALEEVAESCGDATLSDGVRRLALSGMARTLRVDGCFWQDVDTPEMLNHALSQRSHWAPP